MSHDRYSRHALIGWFSQDRVRRARFIVAGAGAIGNEVIKNLALLGAGHVAVHDFDRIEVHNADPQRAVPGGRRGAAQGGGRRRPAPGSWTRRWTPSPCPGTSGPPWASTRCGGRIA